MDNLRGALLMLGAMACFSIEDAFIKALSQTLSTGQIVFLLGCIAAPVFALQARREGVSVFSRAALHPAVILRSLGELVGTIFFVTALALVPLSTASVILQAMPLVVTVGAALFLGERVGWRRWTAIVVGFTGMLVIVRPGGAGFDPAALFAVAAVVALAIRDLVTRRIPAHVASVQVSTWGVAFLIPAGLLMLPFGAPFRALTLPETGLMAGVAVFGIAAYACLTAATRAGEVSFVAPFRYARILFALIIGNIIFAERPDVATLVGAVLIIGSGLYTFVREQRLSMQRRSR